LRGEGPAFIWDMAFNISKIKFYGKLIPNVKSTDLNKASDYIGPLTLNLP